MGAAVRANLHPALTKRISTTLVFFALLPVFITEGKKTPG